MKSIVLLIFQRWMKDIYIFAKLLYYTNVIDYVGL